MRNLIISIDWIVWLFVRLAVIWLLFGIGTRVWYAPVEIEYEKEKTNIERRIV